MNIPTGDSNSPSFFPPLFLQRRAFILSTLKNAGVTSCVEIGCGEGQVLSSFCQPAAHLDIFPTPITTEGDSSAYKAKAEHLNTILQALPPDTNGLGKDLHLERLVGLDVDLSALKRAVVATTPQSLPNLTEDEQISGLTRNELRWEPLKVELWHGSLDVFNPRFADYDAFVATEVVEHLPDGVLSKFGRVILGRYRPRIAIITTPDYDFRPHFPTSDKDSHYYPDPTKRTDRVFRHHDHLFEWTGPEFRTWCDGLAKDYDYDVEYSGVGDLSSFKPQTQTTGLCASQCVVFTARADPEENDRSPRSPLPSALPFYSPDLAPDTRGSFAHKRQHTHIYSVMPKSGTPESSERICEGIKLVLEQMGTNTATLRELWARAIVSQRCGGLIGALLEALLRDPEGHWDVRLSDSSNTTTGLEAISIVNNAVKRDDVEMAEIATISQAAPHKGYAEVDSEMNEWPTSTTSDTTTKLNGHVGGWD